MSFFKTIALVGAVLAATPASAASFISNETGPYLLPGTGTAGPANPFPITFTVAGLGSITDVNLTLTGLTHTYSANLVVALVSPKNTAVLLMSDVGSLFGSFSNANITFDQDVSVSLPEYGYRPIASGSYRPSVYGFNPLTGLVTNGSNLDLFDGENPNGTWSLYIFDDFLGGTGKLTSATLSISAQAVPEPATWALLVGGFALAGLQLRRRKTNISFA